MSTIAAIATSLGSSGVNIIRISGEDSFKIISTLFNNYDKLQPNSIIYGKIIDNNDIIDNVLVSYFKNPNSFTGEDIIEINCHGGTYITKNILDLVIKNGAKIASPGEFSKRAFLNGKMDLSEAESVIDLINAKTKIEVKIASNQLQGEISNKVMKLREKLIEILAQIEVSVDYPEYDYEEIENNMVIKLLDEEIEEINNLVNSYEEGKYIKNGINVAILGRTNVGKSSLLNKLANYDRSIVTDIAGTTRDIVEETINIRDVILNISDTAGIRETEDIIEQIGVKKSIDKLEVVDLVIYVLNAEKNISDDDKKMLLKIQNKGIKYITVINKSDIYNKSIFDQFMDELREINIENPINISVKDNIGIEELKDKIVSLFLKDNIQTTNEIIIVNERHKNLLVESLRNLINAKKEVLENKPIDIISIEIKEAATKLGNIVGKEISVNIIDKIFEMFCLGK